MRFVEGGGSGRISGFVHRLGGNLVGVLLVALVDGELVLVEQVGDLLIDRSTLRVLDPARLLLVGVKVPGRELVAA